MTTPNDLVQIHQSDLDGFAAKINTAAGEITTATGVLKTFIQTLLANQNPPLAKADEDALTNAVDAIAAAGDALTALEPPAPPAPTP